MSVLKKRRNVANLGAVPRRTERAEDFGIEPDYAYRARQPSANDLYREVTVTLPYVRWLGRVKVSA